MIAFLRGVLDEKRLSPAPASAVLDVGGVGYELSIPLSTYDALPRPGTEVKLLVSEVIREDAHLAFGFATSLEKDLFQLLQSVSGVGPKTALSALSGARPEMLRAAIAGGDAKALARFPGIGKRTAERICVELKGKINPIEGAAAQPSGDGAGDSAFPAEVARDAVMALVQLGQSEDAAVRAVRQIMARQDAPADTAAIVRLALSGANAR
ncbi:MAG: Holliday junction branch migration protein RuvA [Kiritimatiellae bacterium]|nr:Holliday junction branch migration protein RuvA [Kiritimatiellia bacterium]